MTLLCQNNTQNANGQNTNAQNINTQNTIKTKALYSDNLVEEEYCGPKTCIMYLFCPFLIFCGSLFDKHNVKL